MQCSERRQRFRTVLASGKCVHPGSVFDPISARIAEDLGFEIGMFAGSVASLTVLGAPDLIVLTLSEFADQAHRICRAGTLPLLVDADHGYGNALNVMRTVEELETAGVAAMTIEDTELPRTYGSGGGSTLISLEESVGKMKAALAARQDPDLVIVGRTGSTAGGDIDDAVTRARAYAETGVDALFLLQPKTREMIEAVAAAVDVPLIVGGAAKELIDLDYLASQNVRVCLQGHQPFMAAVQAVHATLKALREGTAPSALGGVAGADLMKQVTRAGDYDTWTKDFLGG
jgi:carboxyvinyl-carboxyphosphonate phosphorylmutase